MKNELSRREFLGNAAAGVGALALPGFAAAAEAKKPRHQILAARLDLGTRYEQVEPWIWDPDGRFFGPTTEIYLDSLDARVTRMAKLGFNVVLLDMREGLRLKTVGKAVPKGAVKPKELNEHIRAWKELGVRTVPLLNFATVHSSWMGHPSRMTSTRPYYAFCRDVLKEVYDVLEKPAFIHLGLEGESIPAINGVKARFTRPAIITRRKGKILWHDVNYLIEQVEKTGAHAWMSATGELEDFVKNVSKSVLVSPGYGGLNEHPGEALFEKVNRPALKKVVAYAENGYRIVPCMEGNSGWWYYGVQDPKKVFLDKQKAPPQLVGYVREHVDPSKLYGFATRPFVPAGQPGDDMYIRMCDALAKGLANPMTIPPEPEKAPEEEKKA